jgi:hypothetical protein
MFTGSLVALLVHRHPVEIATLGLGAALFLMGWGEVMDANPSIQLTTHTDDKDNIGTDK